MAKEIKSTGPIPCPIMLVAERPGREEQSRGRVLVGPSGQETDRYLWINSGIKRDEVYATNLVKDYRDGENPEQWEIDRDLPLLDAELQRVRPKFIGLVGFHSAHTLLGRGVHDIQMEWSHGLCFWWNKSRLFMPILHPAHGLHRPSEQGKIAWDFTQFGKMVRGEKLPNGHLAKEIETNYGKAVHNGMPIRAYSKAGVDTEGSVEHPWGFSYSGDAGFGRVVCEPSDWTFDDAVLHNGIHDLPILKKLEVRVEKFTDTMLMAALLGTEPLGLKALARRHCGMVMNDYQTVIAPAKREKALDYLARVLEYAEAQSQS